MTCPAGTLCVTGVCTNCYVSGCPAGSICKQTTCQPDACAGKTCPPHSFCSAGNCIKSCTGVSCPSGQSCRAGACVADRCAGVACPRGQVCNAASGRCAANPC